MSAISLVNVCEKLGVSKESLTAVDVLVLPENLKSASSTAEFHDTDDSIFLAKHLKQKGLSCRTAFDLGMQPGVRERRGADVWLGVIWVLNNVALPTIVSILSNYIYGKWSRPPGNRQMSTLANKSVTVHVDIRIHRDNEVTQIDFSGAAEDLARMLSALGSNQEISENGNDPAR